MNPNQRYSTLINTEAEDDDLPLHKGEFKDDKENKTHLCRKKDKIDHTTTPCRAFQSAILAINTHS